MAIITGSLLATDGTRLFYREWPVNQPRAALVLVHGLGEHSERYAHVARRLNSRGIAVRALDLRGHGRSDGQRGGLHRNNDLLTDLKLVFDDYALKLGTTPFLLGHSLGGLVAARFVSEALSPVRGLILSAPALALRLSLFETSLFAFSSVFTPNLAIDCSSAMTLISHDPSVQALTESDPLMHHQITPRLLGFMLSSITRVFARAAQMNKPSLLLVPGADTIVDPEGSYRYFQQLNPALATLHRYDEGYHELFNEAHELRRRVLNDLCIWFDAQLPKPVRF